MTKEVARDVLIVGLRNAHAMERQTLELMERQAERLDEYLEVKERARQHKKETEAQLQRLEQCLGTLGEDRSMFKDATLAALGNVAAMGHAMAEDEVIKNMFGNYGMEHYEIAAYRSLLLLAGEAGFDELRPLLQQSLEEEEQMAAWIEQNLESVTLKYVSLQERERENS